MKRIVVTGATGFIGKHCLPILAERGYEIHAVSSRAITNDAPAVVWHRADLLDQERTAGLVSKIRPSHLLHLAWETEPGQYWTSPDNVRWLHSGLSLLHAFSRCGGSRAVVAGTCFEYDLSAGRCSEETTPMHPSTLYGLTKLSLHLMLDDLSRRSGLSAAWGRIFFLYGPHERAQRFIPMVIRSLLENRPVTCNHSDQTRDFLHVQDVADAVVALLESDTSGPVNIASGRPVLLGDLVNTIASKLGRNDLVRLETKPASPIAPHVLVAETQRLFREVGWSPRYDLEGGLEQTITWWQQNSGREAGRP